ncbi:MAG: D-aminoacylase, partial [Rudaea sp.]
MRRLLKIAAAGLLLLLLAACQQQIKPQTPDYDLIIRHGSVYDGSGAAALQADIGVRGEHVATIGDLSKAHATREVEAKGLAVAPGFINMLSWAPDSLFVDGRSMSDIKQGVTLEVFGEGESLGPLTPQMRETAL